MPERSEPQFVAVAEISVIAHFAGDEDIGALLHGFIDEKVPGTAAKGHGGNFALRPCRIGKAIGAEYRFQKLQKVGCGHGTCQRADNAAAALAAGRGLQEPHVLEPEHLGCCEVHAAPRIVEVGVRGIDADAGTDGIEYATPHDGGAVDALHAAKEQRVVRHDEVAALSDGFCYDLFGHVKTQ